MATHVIARRLQLLIQRINEQHFPSKSEIIEWFKDKDFNISKRTFERDLERIRVDYGVEITYNKAEEGYHIDREKSVKVESFFRFLEIVNIADIFSESLKDSNKILDIVDFDDSKSFKGIENLKPLLLALRENRFISFEHENYSKNTITTYRITPLKLKEYENRWYVIGVPGSINDIRTFGIDRILNLKIEGISSKRKEMYENQLLKFDNIIGLHYEDNQPVKVRLLVNKIHIKYMRSLPLHHSQVIHSANENGHFEVDFYLVPNYEFKTQILKMGPDALVLSPDDLKIEIKNLLSKTIKRYTT